MIAKTVSAVAFLGSGSGQEGDQMYELMLSAGRILARLGITVVTGAYGGSGMEAPARGALEGGGNPVGFGLLGIRQNPFIRIFQDCGYTRTVDEVICLEEQYGRRLARLLERDAFIVGADGGVGTVAELAALVNLNLKLWPRFGRKCQKRVAILTTEGVECSLLKHFNLMATHPTMAEVIGELFRVVDAPQLAVDWVLGMSK